MWLGVSAGFPAPPDGDDFDVDASCIVENDAYTLACDEPGGTRKRVFGLYPPEIDIGIEVGDAVHLRAARNDITDFGGYQFLALRNAEGTLVAATFRMSGAEVPPHIDVAAFYAPITFEVAEASCDPMPVCDGLISVECPSDTSRLAVDFTHDRDTARIWGMTTADLGPFRVRVDTAQLYVPVDGGLCSYGDRPFTTLEWDALRPM